MYAYMYVFTYICKYIYIYIYEYIYEHIYVYMYMYIHIYMYIYICIYICIYVSYICVYIYTYKCIYFVLLIDITSANFRLSVWPGPFRVALLFLGHRAHPYGMLGPFESQIAILGARALVDGQTLGSPSGLSNL